MIIILIGPPGSGKGTHGDYLAKKLRLNHVSIGDIFRVMAKVNDDDGKLISNYMAQGKLVPTPLVNTIVQKFLSKEEYRQGCILDGYPRNIEQAEFLKTMADHAINVIHFAADDQVTLKRILGRFTCGNCGQIYNSYFVKPKVNNVCDVCGFGQFVYRSDDNEVTVKQRLESYKLETAPLIDYYKHNSKIYYVDANKEKAEVEGLLNGIVKMI